MTVQFRQLAEEKRLITKGKEVIARMARVPQVTRTIQTTKATVLCLDLAEKKPFEKTVTLSRTYKNEKEMMKKISPMIDSETVKAVHVISSEVEETLYGMSEQKFIETADIISKR